MELGGRDVSDTARCTLVHVLVAQVNAHNDRYCCVCSEQKPPRPHTPSSAWYKMKEAFKMSFTASSDDDISEDE